MTFQQLLTRLTPISITDRLFFVQYLSVMLKAGMSLAPALASIAEQTRNARLKEILMQIKTSVEHGSTFTQALTPYTAIFGALFVNMVKSGEASGTLEGVLRELYLQIKKDHNIQSKVRAALVYPVVILTVMVTIGIGVMVFIVPKLTSLFADMNATLPLATRLLIATSTLLTSYGVFVALGVVALAVAFVFVIRTPRGKSVWHTFLLRAPVIGPIVAKVNIARMTRTLGTLLTTDLPITEALAITSGVVGNVHYRTLLLRAVDEVKRGVGLSRVFPQFPRLVPPTLAQMVVVGEETGSLDAMLKEIAGFYEGEVTQTMEMMPSIIEPLLMVFLGVGVGGMAVAIVMPMYSLAEQM